MSARTECFRRQFSSLMLWLAVLLLTEFCKANDVTVVNYAVHVTGELIKVNGTRTISISCFFQEGIPEIESVSLQRQIDGPKWEILLEAKPDVEGGSAKVVTTPRGTKVSTSQGSVQDRRLNLLFSDVTGEHTGLYYCNVTYKSGLSSKSVYVNAERATEINQYPVVIQYNMLPQLDNTSAMEISCAFEHIPSVDKATMRRTGQSRMEDLLRADITIDRGGAQLLTPPDVPRLVAPQGGVQEGSFSAILPDVTPTDSGVYECHVVYSGGDGCSQGKLFIRIGPEPEDEEEAFIGSPIKSSRGSMVDKHGHPAFMASIILLCSMFGLYVVGDFP